jgi:hypothetical protein
VSSLDDVAPRQDELAKSALLPSAAHSLKPVGESPTAYSLYDSNPAVCGFTEPVYGTPI